MIENFQNNSKSGWKDTSFRGYSQRQFNYHDQIPHGWGFQHADNRYLPHETSGPTIPTVAHSRHSQPVVCCKICDVMLPSKNMEQHKKGKKHRRMLALRQKSKRRKTSNGQESRQITNSQMNSVIQPKTVLNSEATSSKHKNYLKKDIGVTPEVSAEGPEGKPRDNISIKGHGLKHMIGGATGVKYMKTNDGIRIPMESSKPEVNPLSNSAESLVQIPASVLPPGPVASPIMAPIPVAGSSFELQFQHVSASQTQVSKGKEHHEIQNPTVETNDQPPSLLVELHAPAGSNISIQTEDTSSDSAAIATSPPKGPVASQTEVSEGKEHEIQNPTVETNEQLQKISSEFHARAGSNISTQTEDMSSDSAAIATSPKGPVASQTEVSEGKEHEIQNPTVETNEQLQNISSELHAPVGSNISTQTEDMSSDSAAIATSPPKGPMSQVTVCLMCGDEGFPETLVFCNKCQVYAVHRYCLDGPVIFVDDVTWLCEDCDEEIVGLSSHDQDTLLQSRTNNSENSGKDASQAPTELTNCRGRVKENKQQQQSICEAEVVDTSSHDQCIVLPFGTSDSINSAEDASQARTEITNSIERVKENKQQQPKIAAKRKVLSSDCHNTEAKKLKKDCQSVSESKANASEGSMTVVVDPQPIADPIWRGSFCLSKQSSGSVTGLLAHLSTLACYKVLEETRLFPEVLSADLLQTSAVWPKSFMKSRPNHESIALYFFPENERVEKEFDKLVDDMISHDLSIRSEVKNAELLVFPSTLLPIKYRRFQSKYYLWGVFRARQTSAKTNEAVSREDTSVDKLKQ